MSIFFAFPYNCGTMYNLRYKIVTHISLLGWIFFITCAMNSALTGIEQYIVDFVIKLRKERKQTQEDIAFILGVDRSFIVRVENPRHHAKYNVNHIAKLADHFNISPREFLPEVATIA